MSTTITPPLTEIAQVSERIEASIARVIEGKPQQIHLAVVVLLAEGHLLLEDVPGVGKTALASALGRSIAGDVKRIQFTPDLLPSDVTGVSVFNQDVRQFEFKQGSVFANIVIGDEINRASPKTQSALLEAMAEGRFLPTATPIRYLALSWWWQPRTQSKWRGPTHSPRHSEIGSWPESKWAIPATVLKSGC